MKIDAIIDGKTLSLDINSNKPLSLILMEDLANDSIKSHCQGNGCGLCVVIMDGKAVLSCMVPAFQIRGKSIITFESFSKSRNYRDIEKAYDACKVRPCPICYKAKTMLLETLINQGITDKGEIRREISSIRCSCMEAESCYRVVLSAIEIRRRRRARKS